MSKNIKKECSYLAKNHSDLFVLQGRLLDLEEENIIGDCTPLLKRIERVRDGLDKIIDKILKKAKDTRE